VASLELTKEGIILVGAGRQTTNQRWTMTVTFDLPYAVLQQLTDKAATNGQSLEEYLQGVVLREAQAPSPSPVAGPLVPYPMQHASPQEKIKALHEWAESHSPVHHFVDDSRESIYFGRG
jgi:hypothetical protein